MKNISAIILAILAIFFSGCANIYSEPPYLETNIKSGNYIEGEEINLNILAKNTQSVKIFLGEKTEVVECENNYCSISKSVNLKQGVYKIRVVASGEGGKKEETATITVLGPSKKCIGGLLEGQCSKEKPKMCINGALKDKCSVCGCDNGAKCVGESCETLMPLAKKIEVSYPKKIGELQPFKMLGKIFFEGQVNSKKAVAKIFLGQNEFTNDISISTNEKTVSEFEVLIPAISKGKYDLRVEIYEKLENEKPIITYFEKEAILVVEKGDRLPAPEKLSGFSEGNDIILNWKEVEGANSYNIYKSIDANPAFISYKIIGVASGENSFVLQSQKKGTHFFVVTAVDIFGIESDYSNVIAVNVN